MSKFKSCHGSQNPIRRLTDWLLCLVLVMFSMASTSAFAGVEVEPNNTCATAQGIGTLVVGSPVTVNGALVTPPTSPDVDYYKVTATTPGDVLRINLAGQSNGTDTLGLPMVTVLNSACGFIQNSGANDPIAFDLTIPADGVVILAVTSWPDWQLAGAGDYAGTYSMTLVEVQPVPSISGRLVDATTAQPVPFFQVNLNQCSEPTCSVWPIQTVGYAYSDAAGQFTFNSSYFGSLLPGTYQVVATDYSGRYLPFKTDPFTATSGTPVVLGDLSLSLAPVIGSISGRVIDAVTHAPLSGVGVPHAYISLSGCSTVSFGCSYASGYTDSQGRFKFTQDSSGRELFANAVYFVSVSADQYQQTYIYSPQLGQGANADLGDILAVSNPIRFVVQQGCSDVPVTGGKCRYKVQIINGAATRVRGGAWATVQAYGLGSFVYSSVFQTDELQEMELAGATRTARASRIATFDFTVPASLPLYASVCPTFWFGSDRDNPQLNVLGAWTDYNSCLQRTANGVVPVSEEEAHHLRTKEREHEGKERAEREKSRRH